MNQLTLRAAPLDERGSGAPAERLEQRGRLRHKLGDDVASSPLIKTVRNEGYVLASAVTME